MASFSLNTLPLEGDGVVENLFHYLWYKDELDCGPKISIPDTIIYKFRQPAYWYFTSKSGEIKKKARYNLANIKIEETFTKKAVGSDIIAYYLSTNAETNVTTIEYFDQDSLRDFLYKREKVDNGILQRFIEPKGTRNLMMRGIWSPKIVLVERRENLQHLNDQKYSLYERAVTFEGAEHYSRTAPVRGSTLPVNIQNVCRKVVDHVSEVSFRKCNISRMALNFKVDGEDRIWLLWCTSLRLEQNLPPRLGQSSNGPGVVAPVRQKRPSKHGPVSMFVHCQVPESVQRAFQSSTGGKSPVGKSHSLRPNNVGDNEPLSPDPNTKQTYDSNVVPIKLNMCRSCRGSVLVNRFCNVSYKVIVSHFEQFMSVLAANSSDSMRIEWPPSQSVADAIGGNVGLGPLEKIREAIRVTKDKSKVSITQEDVEIPPLIRDNHANLLAHDYHRLRRDPMFLYKTTPVCDECYLVFAQVGAEAHQAQQQALSKQSAGVEERRKAKLEANNERARKDHVDRASVKRRENKERRKREMERISKSKQKNSGYIANGLNKLDGPTLPPRIDERNVKTLSITKSAPVLQTQIEYQQEDHYGGDDIGDGDEDLPPEFRKELADRENAFFRDLYRNPNLEHGHPLSHMVATQASLSLAESGAQPPEKAEPQHPVGKNPTSPTGPKRSPRSPNVSYDHLMRVFTEKEIDTVDFSSPYAQTQVIIQQQQQKKKIGKRARKSRHGTRDVDAADQEQDQRKPRPATTESEGAAEHRDFLLSTLQRVQDQLANPMPLNQAIKLGNVADTAGIQAQQAQDYQDVWEQRNEVLAATPSDLGRIYRGAIEIDGERLLTGVDIQESDFMITVFNPKLAVSQRLQVPTSVVLENAPEGATTSEQLAKFIVDSLEQDDAPALFPDSVSVKVPFHN